MADGNGEDRWKKIEVMIIAAAAVGLGGFLWRINSVTTEIQTSLSYLIERVDRIEDKFDARGTEIWTRDDQKRYEQEIDRRMLEVHADIAELRAVVKDSHTDDG